MSKDRERWTQLTFGRTKPILLHSLMEGCFMDLFWLLPVVAVVVVGAVAFYVKIMKDGGTGERTDGKVLLDRPAKRPGQDEIIT